jgi:hypothetical protein
MSFIDDMDDPEDIYYSNGLFVIFDWYDDTFFFSMDGMETWNALQIFEDYFYVNDILYVNGTVFIATEEGGIHKTEDFGFTIDPVNEGIIPYFERFGGEINVSDLEYIDNVIYASTMAGVFTSTDMGENWNLIEDIPNKYTIGLSLLDDGYIYASTIRGLYRSSEKVVSVEDQDLKSEVEITVYPNPVQDYIELEFSPLLRVAGGVFEVAIYNILGENMPNLSSAGGGGNAVAGGGQFRIDVSNLPPGMYFIKIGDRVQKFVKE